MQRLQFYDWEANVIGPGGTPAPGDPTVTGGTNAGRAGALPIYDAVLRAASRPARIEANNGRSGSIFFALDIAHRRVVGSAAATRAQAVAKAPAGARIYEVRPDTAIVHAETAGDRWYVLKDDVALRGSEVRNPRQGTDQTTHRPVTLFSLSDAGRVLFRRLTRTIAGRGSQNSLNAINDDPAIHNQHFAVVYEGQIVTIPFVDFRQSPDGLDARSGLQLTQQLP
jgi:SecD/SecF fusion protein